MLLADGTIEDREIPNAKVGDVVKGADDAVEGIVVGSRGSKSGISGAKSSAVSKFDEAAKTTAGKAKNVEDFKDLSKMKDSASRANSIRGGRSSAFRTNYLK